MLLTALGKYAATNAFIRIKIRSAAGEKIDLYTQHTIFTRFLDGTAVSVVSQLKN